MPLFTVLITTYNRASFVVQAIDSALRQTFTDFEIVVVDDGSTDGTADRLAQFGDRIRLVRQPNRGVGNAYNSGIREARGEYVAFLDSDDLWMPWVLEVYAHAIDQAPAPGVILASLFPFSKLDEVEKQAAQRGPTELVTRRDYLAFEPINIFRGAGVLAVKTEALRRVGGFHDAMFKALDHDLLYRLGTEPGFVYVRSPMMLAYRQHPGASAHDAAGSYRGIVYLIAGETMGRYAGGAERSSDRRRQLSFTVRCVSRWLTEKGYPRWGWELYQRGLRWNVRERRFRYVFGFPLVAALAIARQSFFSRPPPTVAATIPAMKSDHPGAAT